MREVGRLRWSCTVDFGIPVAAAICRSEKLAYRLRTRLVRRDGIGQSWLWRGGEEFIVLLL